MKKTQVSDFCNWKMSKYVKIMLKIVEKSVENRLNNVENVMFRWNEYKYMLPGDCPTRFQWFWSLFYIYFFGFQRNYTLFINFNWFEPRNGLKYQKLVWKILVVFNPNILFQEKLKIVEIYWNMLKYVDIYIYIYCRLELKTSATLVAAYPWDQFSWNEIK